MARRKHKSHKSKGHKKYHKKHRKHGKDHGNAQVIIIRGLIINGKK